MSRLLIAHGSPDARHHQTMRRLAELTAANSGVVTRVAFLDHDEPSVVDELEALYSDLDGETVDTLGLFLSDGYHARVDVPEALSEAGKRVTLIDHGTLGMGSWLFTALERGLADVGCDVNKPTTGVVLVAAGSARAEAREEVVQLACAWQRERGGPVRPAFASGPGPTLEEALSMLSDAACTQRIIAPLMLAPGVLADRVTDAAKAHSVAVGTPIGLSCEVIDRIVERTSSARLSGL